MLLFLSNATEFATIFFVVVVLHLGKLTNTFKIIFAVRKIFENKLN